jgi:SAM-dependent methyltransferase
MNKKAFNDYSCRSNIYDIEYAAVYDLPFWTRLAAGVNTILEVPCGSGVRALHLASLGKDVTAVDIEPNMVALLQQKLANSSSFLKVTPKLADMRRLELASWFDAVFVIREGFQFLVDDGEAIETMRCLARHLRTDGFIAIDLADFAVSAKGSSYRLEYYDKNQPDHLWIDEWRRPVDDA